MTMRYDSATCDAPCAALRRRGQAASHRGGAANFRLRLMLPVLALAQLLAAGRAGADNILKWNEKPDRAHCPVGGQAVWVQYAGGQDCIRYFHSGGLDGAPIALVVMGGDKHLSVRKPPETIPDNTAEAQEARARRWAQAVGVPVIILARPGTYGSSGNHFHTRRAPEFRAINAALDAIRMRHRFSSFAVAGHSGGATAAGALLTMGRTDIPCVVLTSGAFSLEARDAYLAACKGDARPRPAPADRYDPLHHVAGVRPQPGRRIHVVGDPRDTVTPFDLQLKFAEALRKRGESVSVIIHEGAAPRFHDLKGNVGLRIAAACARQARDIAGWDRSGGPDQPW